MSELDTKRGPGRPPFREGTAKTSMFTLRVSDEERAAFREAAKRAGKPVTQWARETLLRGTRVKPEES